MPGFREVFIQQSTHAVSAVAADAVRTSRPKTDKEAPPEPTPRPALRAAEELLARRKAGEAIDEETGQVFDPSGPLFYPDGIFDGIHGRELEKTTLRLALAAPRPVHVLLVGDPASGKSDLLRCCAEQIPRARYAVGGMTTSSGIVQYMLEQPGTSLLLVDELDKFKDTGDYAALYELMESGQVPRLQHGKTEVLRWRGRVFAAANQTERIPQALLSRFRIVRLEAYSKEQLLEVNRLVAEREGVSPQRAAQIAQLTAGRSNDPRDARDLARLAGEEGPLEGLLEAPDRTSVRTQA